jgi:nucleoside-diphosphate-sugar epimerase
VNILIAGCGDIGTRLGLKLAADGHGVWGLKRTTATLTPPIRPLRADLTRPDSLVLPREPFEYVFYTVAADGYSEAHYRAAYVDGVAHLLAALAAAGQQPRRVLLVSSTSVYAQRQGEWVDEHSPATATGFSGRCLREGEELLWRGPYPATVIRFAGIYGPGRTRLIDSLRTGSARCLRGVFSNRIHSEDCARALRHLMALDHPEALYLGVDDSPAPLCEVLGWLAHRLGVAGPQVADEARDDARQRSVSNKRCSNARLRASGFEFLYPGYQQGYEAMLSDKERGASSD